jgi:hypothetical protein
MLVFILTENQLFLTLTISDVLINCLQNTEWDLQLAHLMNWISFGGEDNVARSATWMKKDSQEFISESARIKAAIYSRLDNSWKGLGPQNTKGIPLPYVQFPTRANIAVYSTMVIRIMKFRLKFIWLIYYFKFEVYFSTPEVICVIKKYEWYSKKKRCIPKGMRIFMSYFM